MRIWYLNHFASTPDQPSTGAYFLMNELAARGHEVTIFASGFNYYLRNTAKMRGRLFSRRERVSGVDFLWLRTWPTQGGMFTRFLNMKTYFLASLAAGIFARQKPDVVIGTCPHPLAALAAWLLARRHGARFVYEVRDIWPESLSEGGHFSENSFFMRLMMRLQLFLYRRAFLLTSVIPGFGDYLSSKGIGAFDFLWLPNGISIERGELTQPSGGPASPDAPFKVFYFGGHSKHQALDTLLEAAQILGREALPIRIIMVGEGTEKPRLMEKAKAMGLANLEFRAAVPRREVKKAAAEADCFLAHNRTIPVLRFGGGMNKMCDFMLGARPIVNASGMGNDPVAENSCGVTVPPCAPLALADAIKSMHALSPEARREMGARAQAYALETFDAAKLAARLDEALQPTPFRRAA